MLGLLTNSERAGGSGIVMTFNPNATNTGATMKTRTGTIHY